MGIAKKKRITRMRAIVLLSVHLLIAIHITHWLIAKQTLAPLEFNEVLYSLHLGIITAGFIFMGLTVIGTLIFGRFFCSWGCHILALEDLSAWILEKFKIKPAPIRSRAFFLVPVAAMLYLFVWPQIERIINHQPLPQLHIVKDGQGWASFTTTDFWRNLPGLWITLLTFFTVGFAIVYVLGTRSFCRYGCPYGVVFGVADRFAVGKIKLTGNCTDCGICTAHCQSHIQVHKEIKDFGKVVDTACLKDLDCIAVCPENALEYKFTKPTFFQNFLFTKTNNKGYSFSLGEDIALGFFTLVFVFIFRGLYDAVPFLLSITIGIILSYFVILLKRMIKLEYVHLGKIILRKGNRNTFHGKLVIASTLLMLLFSAHSGFVHYHTYRGENIYNEFVISGSSLVSGADQMRDNQKLKKCLEHLETAQRWGLWNTASLERELASIYISNKSYDKAITHLQLLLEKDQENNEAKMRLAKILFITGKEKETLKTLNEIVEQKEPGHLKAEAHLMLGHIDKKNGLYNTALNHYEQALIAEPGHTESMLALGVFYTKAGRLQEAEFFLLKCDSLLPGNAMIQNNLGLIYLKTKRDKEAIERLIKLNELQPENYLASYNAGVLFYKHKQNELAFEYLEKSLQANPGYANAQVAMANLLDTMGRKEEAIVHRKIVNTAK